MAAARRRSNRSRTAKPKEEKAEKAEKQETQSAEQAAAEQAQLDIAEAETQETAEKPEETAEEKEAREKAEFEAEVAKVGEDPIKANDGVKALHAIAVRAEEQLTAAVSDHRKRNATAIESLKKARVRLAAARTRLLAEYKAEVDDNQSTTTVAVDDANKPDTVYLDTLAYDFSDDNEGAEKEYWLSAQRWMTVSGKIGAEPAEIAELRKAAGEAAKTFNFHEAAYKEAIKRAFGK